MNKEELSEQNLTRYLLGELSEKERAQIQQRFLADDNLFERLLALEEDLIESYVRNELSRYERRLFENRFLATPEQRERVELTRVLVAKAAQVMAIESQSEPLLLGRLKGFLSRFSQILEDLARVHQPAFGYALAAVVVLVAILGGWRLLTHNRDLRQQLASVETERAAMAQREQELQQRLVNENAQTKGLETQLLQEQNRLAELERKLTERSLPLMAMVSYTPSPAFRAGSQSEGKPEKLVIPPGTLLVRLRLNLDENKEIYTSYRVNLETPEGEKISSQFGMQSQKVDGAEAVFVTLPTNLFERGEYIIMLHGVKVSGEVEIINGYSLRVVKR